MLVALHLLGAALTAAAMTWLLLGTRDRLAVPAADAVDSADPQRVTQSLTSQAPALRRHGPAARWATRPSRRSDDSDPRRSAVSTAARATLPAQRRTSEPRRVSG